MPPRLLRAPPRASRRAHHRRAARSPCSSAAALLHALEPHPGQIANSSSSSACCTSTNSPARLSRISSPAARCAATHAFFSLSKASSSQMRRSLPPRFSPPTSPPGALAAAAVWLLAVVKVMIAARLAVSSEPCGWAISTSPCSRFSISSRVISPAPRIHPILDCAHLHLPRVASRRRRRDWAHSPSVASPTIFSPPISSRC